MSSNAFLQPKQPHRFQTLSLRLKRKICFHHWEGNKLTVIVANLIGVERALWLLKPLSANRLASIDLHIIVQNMLTRITYSNLVSSGCLTVGITFRDDMSLSEATYPAGLLSIHDSQRVRCRPDIWLVQICPLMSVNLCLLCFMP